MTKPANFTSLDERKTVMYNYKKSRRQQTVSQKTAKTIKTLCIICALIFSVGIILVSLAALSVKSIPFAILSFILSLTAVFICKRYLKPFKHFKWVLFTFRLICCIVFIFLSGAEPTQDFARMYDAAVDISQGSRDYLANDYFYRFPYQTGFAAYEGLVLWITGKSMLAIQLLNAVYMAFTNMLIYLISKRFVNEKSAMTAGILYSLYPAPLFLAGVLTNQHLSVFLLFAAVYILVYKKELSAKRALAAGAVISLGNAMWPVGIIVMLAAVIWAAIRVIKRYSLKRLLSALFIPVGYFVTGALLSALIIVTGLNPEGLTNNRSKWMFVVGLSENGSWNQEDYDKYMFLPEDEVDSAMTNAAINRLCDMGPVGLLKLFVRKCTIIWGNTEDTYWGFGHKEGSTWSALRGIMSAADKGVYLAAFVLCVLGLVSCLKNKKETGAGLLPVLIFCGYFGVYLIIEVQSRYKYAAAAAVFMLAALGIQAIRRKINESTDDKRQPENGLQHGNCT